MENVKNVKSKKSRIFQSPLNIPNGKIGKWEIKQEIVKAGSELPIISQRDAIFTGKKSITAELSTDITIHKLYEDGGLWMTDTPQEQEMHKYVVDKCKGNVLIGGLGLGYIASMLDKKKDVKSITIVEIEKDVIDLVWKHLNLKKAKIVNADLFEYLKKTKQKFDWAYYDIWTPTGEDVLYTHIRPLKTLSEGKVPFPHILCWGEDIMLGQMLFQLSTQIAITDKEGKDLLLSLSKDEFRRSVIWNRTRWPFYNWYRQIKPDKELALSVAKTYVQTYTDVGLWNNIFGKYEYKGGKNE